MAVVITGINSSRSSKGPRGAETFLRTIKMFTDTGPGNGLVDQETDIYAALQALSPPIRIGAPHPVVGIAVCNDLQTRSVARHTTSPATTWEWEATASYSTQNKEPPKDNPDPTKQIPKVSTSNEARKIAATQDEFLQPVVNSSGEPIPLEIDQGFVVIDIECAFSSHVFDFDWLKDAKFDDNGILHSLNDAKFTIPESILAIANGSFDSGCGFMRVLRVSPLRANGALYTIATIQILVDPNGHNVPVLDQGYMKLVQDPESSDPDDEVQIAIQNGGTTPNVPRLLDGKGHELNIHTDKPVILDWQFNPQRSWAWLQKVLDDYVDG